MASRSGCAAATLLSLAALLCSPAAVSALSWPLCEDGGQVWVTERPQTEPTFPGGNLWFFCDTGLNILGVSIHDCINNGTVCTQAIPDALCQSFGFDRAVLDYLNITDAAPDEPVRALTGEYCLRQGSYSQTLPDDLSTLPGAPCRKIQGIACIRTRETIVTALDASILEAFKPAPPSAEPAVPAEPKLSPEQIQEQSAMPAGDAAATGGGARKLLF